MNTAPVRYRPVFKTVPRMSPAFQVASETMAWMYSRILCVARWLVACVLEVKSVSGTCQGTCKQEMQLPPPPLPLRVKSVSGT
jgi:hypothetical protein